MEKNIHNELKKEFQLERMILFSDAVFAIAITLLVIEMKVPELTRELVNEDKLLESLIDIIPKFIGFLVSFFVIGLYWTVHHRMFGYVVGYTQRLLWLNLIFLLSVVLMPFSSGFYSEYIFTLLKTPIIVYVCNICFLGVMNCILWVYLADPQRKLTAGLGKHSLRYFLFRAAMVPAIFLLMAIVYLFLPRLAIFLPMVIPLVMILIKRNFEKKIRSEDTAKAGQSVN